MGSLYSYLYYQPAVQHNETHSNYVVPLCHDDISIYVIHYIHRMSKGLLHKDILAVCTTFIGFILFSNVLRDDENITMYHLLKKHHIQNNIASPLLDTTHISHFALLFRYKAMANAEKRSNLDCHTLIQQCADREDLLMILRTGYNHVFSLFFKKKMEPLNWNVPKFHRVGPRQSTSDEFALFLLRSQFVYADHAALSHTYCPRIIRLNDGSVMNHVCFKARFCPDNPCGSNIYVAGIGIHAATQSMVMTTSGVQALGNEVCGADDGCFDPTNRFYHFSLDELELFQVF
eukprot:1046546_1